jgi:hypothetical protein
MATKEDKARWARERNARLKAGVYQPKRGEGLRKYDHSGPTYKTRPVEYRVWSGMKVRCLNPNFKDWHLYGGKGISVSLAWRDSFETFFRDVGPRPSPNHSLDRFPDALGNYELGNVRWATSREQANNWAFRNKKYSFNGASLTLSEWARQLDITRESLRDRIKSGWSLERALTTPRTEAHLRNPRGRYAAACD